VELVVVIGIIGGSAFAHELGHVIATYYYGGRIQGAGHSKHWIALGVVAVLPDRSNAWKIALAGPLVSALLVCGFWLALPGVYAKIGFVTNLCLLVINLLPFKIADGGHILAHFRPK